MDSVDLIRKIKLARKYILDQEYEQAYNETYLPPEIEETNSLPVEAGVIKKNAEALVKRMHDMIQKNIDYPDWHTSDEMVETLTSIYNELKSIFSL